jgi:hypothetical protein
MWMKVANPNSAQWLNYWQCDDSMTSKNLFLICFCIWFVLLFCRLWQKEFGELVSVMECNPNCSMKTFHELCESWFCKEISSDAPPSSLMDSTASPKLKTVEGEGVGARSLIRNTSGVERCAGASR